MKKLSIRKHHKWFGIIMSFFIIMFCLSGLLLNHRNLINNKNVSRRWLPSRYEFNNWNGGLLRGTHRLVDGYVVVYGSNGMFLTDSTAYSFADFNDGLPIGTDFRQIRNMAITRHIKNGEKRVAMFAVSPFALYRYAVHGTWHTIKLPLNDDERLTDITAHNDTLVVMSRSRIYIGLPPYSSFRSISLAPSALSDGKATSFRTVWMLHSGELFGTTGKLVVDLIAIVLLLICVSGLVFWIGKKTRPSKENMKLKARILKTSLSWHDRVGRYTIILTLFICFTGWLLRPPMMIPLAMTRIPTLPGTTLHSDNAWHDKLRLIRHDDKMGDWLISTSEGFYSLGTSIEKPSIPQYIANTPPVSVMGLNVWQKDKDGYWLCGSFSGMFRWDRQHSVSTDFFTGKEALKKAGAPFGKKAITGYSNDFVTKTTVNRNTHTTHTHVVTEYYDGTKSIRQPEWMNNLPMSLWNVALEVHSGRIFIGNIATYLFVLIMGMAAIWSLWTGYKIRGKRK